MPLKIAEGAGGCDVGGIVLPAVLPCSQVFRRQLVPPDTPEPKPVVPCEVLRVVVPHGVVAVDATAVLAQVGGGSGSKKFLAHGGLVVG